MKISCNICKEKFEPRKENKYVVSRTNFITKAAEYCDAFDCPFCGCQTVVGSRLKRVGCKEESDSEEIMSVR